MSIRTENYSPLDPINSILSGPPGTEAAMCLMIPPEKSLYEANCEDASVVQARQDHNAMRETFEKYGITSYNMREIIGQELARRGRLPFHTREKFLRELEKRALFFHQTYQFAPDFERLIEEIHTLFDEDLRTMGLDAAIAINGVLTNVIDLKGNLKPLDPSVFPAGNFLFWRDTNHVVANKMGTHRMFYDIRDQEVAIAQLGFEALGLEYQPVLSEKSHFNRHNRRNSIEGGDILPMELNGQRYSFIGTAERTSFEAVQAWFTLHEDSFRLSGDGIIPMVVQGPTSYTQDQMHLDTFAQQIAPGALLHCGELTRQREISILMRRGGEIVKVRPQNLSDGTFAEWIEVNATNAYDMTREEQLNYAPNVLVHGSKSKNTTVFVTRDGTPKVTEFIQRHAVDVVLLRMNELTKFYGGAHCSTSELR